MIDITVDGVAYSVPSSAEDTNWQATQVAFEQALATAINEALATQVWSDRTTINSWVNIGGDYAGPVSRLDPFGNAHLRMAVQGGTDNTVALVMPAGQRPPYPIDFVAVCDTGGTVRVTIATNGNVTLAGDGVDAGDGTILECAFSVVADP